MMMGSYEIKTFTVKPPNQNRVINPEHEQFQTHTMNPDYGEILTDFSKELGFMRDHANSQFLFRHTKDSDLEIYFVEHSKIIYVSRLDKEVVLKLEFYETPVDQDRTMLRVVDFVNEMLTTIRDMYKD